MAARKKRAKSKAKPAANSTARLDDGWATFIGNALKKRSTQALWPDPGAGGASRKTSRKAVKRVRKKAK